MRQSNDTQVRAFADLGWANGDATLFPKLSECRKAGHDNGNENLDFSQHGYDTLYFCRTCGYQFHVDSSD